MKAIAVCAMALALVGCDRFVRLSVTRPIPAVLPQACVIEALQRETVVTKLEEKSSSGDIYFVLDVPAHLRTDATTKRPVGVRVYEKKNDRGVLQIEFLAGMLGSAGPAEFQAYLQKTMAEVRDRVVERCGK